jgi:hypothetical protein
MSNSRRFLAIAAFGMVTALTAMVTAAPPAPRQVNVITTIADAAEGFPLRIQSDRQGAYVTKTVNKTVQVKSVIDSFLSGGSDWSLTTYYLSKSNYVASSRTVFFDLSEQITSGAFTTPYLGNGQVTSHLIVKCSNVNRDFLAIPLGTTVSCPGSARFRAPDGGWYRFSFSEVNYPEVDQYAVTCTAADQSGCKVWTVQPDGVALSGDDPNPKSLNRLLLINSNGDILDEGGTYYLSFSMTIAR